MALPTDDRRELRKGCKTIVAEDALCCNAQRVGIVYELTFRDLVYAKKFVEFERKTFDKRHRRFPMRRQRLSMFLQIVGRVPNRMEKEVAACHVPE